MFNIFERALCTTLVFLSCSYAHVDVQQSATGENEGLKEVIPWDDEEDLDDKTPMLDDDELLKIALQGNRTVLAAAPPPRSGGVSSPISSPRDRTPSRAAGALASRSSPRREAPTPSGRSPGNVPATTEEQESSPPPMIDGRGRSTSISQRRASPTKRQSGSPSLKARASPLSRDREEGNEEPLNTLWIPTISCSRATEIMMKAVVLCQQGEHLNDVVDQALES